jgi:hypothetical protein
LVCHFASLPDADFSLGLGVFLLQMWLEIVRVLLIRLYHYLDHASTSVYEVLDAKPYQDYANDTRQDGDYRPYLPLRNRHEDQHHPEQYQ